MYIEQVKPLPVVNKTEADRESPIVEADLVVLPEEGNTLFNLYNSFQYWNPEVKYPKLNKAARQFTSRSQILCASKHYGMCTEWIPKAGLKFPPKLSFGNFKIVHIDPFWMVLYLCQENQKALNIDSMLVLSRHRSPSWNKKRALRELWPDIFPEWDKHG